MKEAFPCIMAAVVKAVHKYPDLMRMSIAAPGNDFRLGAMEAPPAIISTYLGEALTDFMGTVMNEQTADLYAPPKKTVDPAPGKVAPFTYGGHRFEFRAVGSSQNVSMVNTVLCSAIAKVMDEFCAELDAGKPAMEIAAAALAESETVIFNGNGYSAEWPVEAAKRGLLIENSNPESIQFLKREKNIELFEKLGVMTKKETIARADVMHEQYVGMVEIEANVMVEMIETMALPAVKAAGLSTSEMAAGAAKIKSKLEAVLKLDSPYEQAKAARVLRLETMEDVRKVCDEMETKVPAGTWPIA